MYFSAEELNASSLVVHQFVSPTQQYAWPLLAGHTGCEVWVKHENHTPTGAFKIRGGVTYMEALKVENPSCQGVIAATTGNHGQSIAVAAANSGLASVIVVPENNSPGKNRAIRAQGARLVVHGTDFQEALDHAKNLAEELSFHMVPSFDRNLVKGVASYGVELFCGVKDLHTVYVPIGLGTGICGVICAREALRLTTHIVGVQSEGAPSYALSFKAKRPVSTNEADTFAAGLATRVPDPDAVSIVNRHAERVVTVSDAEILEAQALLLRDTHNLAEPAGAATYAALFKERKQMAKKRVGVILSGGNAESENLRQILLSPSLNQKAHIDD
jgi:threonine dehydratase